MIEYYPPQLSISRLNNIIAKDAALFQQLDPAGLEPVFFRDEVEEQRLADVASLQARGKGKPKKARTPGMYTSLVSHVPYELIVKFQRKAEEQRRRAVVARRSSSESGITLFSLFTISYHFCHGTPISVHSFTRMSREFAFLGVHVFISASHLCNITVFPNRPQPSFQGLLDALMCAN